jgi:hypothetical protein
MSPDNEATNPVEQNPTLAEDDKFRRTVEPSSGPNTSGYDDLVKASHTRADETFTPADKVEIEPAMDSAIKRDVEPSMPAPDAAPEPPSAPQED